MNKHGLRFKLALTFALFGAVISLLISLSLLFVAHNLGERLIDETLRAELDDYLSRRARNPASLPPATLSMRGYVQRVAEPDVNFPAALRDLAEGRHQITLEGVPYRALVRELDLERYYMLFNEERQLQREQSFKVYLSVGATLMIVLSAIAGGWLAGRVVSPVVELARRVGNAHPGETADAVAQGMGQDEIGQLARVFEDYLKRMKAFIDREQNFTSDVSHELRTPLAIMQGVVELMEDDATLGDKQKERIARIARANQAMINLTAALLLMAREDSNPEEVSQTCDVCELTAQVIEAHRHLLNPHTEVHLLCDARPALAAERTLLSIVVANLVRNAFTHTPAGSVTITVGKNTLSVQDTGTGIRGEEIGKVFQRHFKGTGSSGSGIGLSLVKRICERYGWEIRIESEVNKGTLAVLIF